MDKSVFTWYDRKASISEVMNKIEPIVTKGLNPYTGNQSLITTVKCNCECHQPGTAIMHFVACCDNGYVTSYEDIDGDGNVIKRGSILENLKLIVPRKK